MGRRMYRKNLKWTVFTFENSLKIENYVIVLLKIKETTMKRMEGRNLNELYRYFFEKGEKDQDA